MKLFLAARSAPVVQIHFPANLGGPALYVTASQAAIQQAVRQFLGEHAVSAGTPAPPSPSGGGRSPRTAPRSTTPPAEPAPPPLIDSHAPPAQQCAAKLAGTKTKSGKPMLDFPVYYPTKLAPGSTITDDSRAFPIDGPGSDVYHGYKMVVDDYRSDGYTAYYGVSGARTGWTRRSSQNPDETKTIDGQRVPRVLGRRPAPAGRLEDRQGLLLDRQHACSTSLTPGQMLGIAQSMRKYTG